MFENHFKFRKNNLCQYDVIIIGGGPAGSVIARKISDDPRYRVLLIEAGNASQRDLGGQVGHFQSFFLPLTTHLL